MKVMSRLIVAEKATAKRGTQPLTSIMTLKAKNIMQAALAV